MLELGDQEQEGHEKVGMRALDVVDILITVGQLGKIISDAALRWGLPSERVFVADDNAHVIQLLESMVGEGDIILVKGSRGMKMEEIVSALGRG